MSSREGGQSPPPERQTGAQQQDTPAQGQGTDNAQHKEATNKSSLEVRSAPWTKFIWIAHADDVSQGLSSNPAGPLDEALKEKFSKTQQ